MMVMATLVVMINYTAGAQGNAAARPVSSQTQTTGQQQSSTAEVADKNLKGPKGETVYTSPQGGKYYYTADHRKIYMESAVDKNLKGPNGETVYITAAGDKYYMNQKGEKIYLKRDQQTAKPAPDKKGTVKKANSPASPK